MVGLSPPCDRADRIRDAIAGGEVAVAGIPPPAAGGAPPGAAATVGPGAAKAGAAGDDAAAAVVAAWILPAASATSLIAFAKAAAVANKG